MPTHVYVAAQRADFALHVLVTYLSINSSVESLDSGRVSIRSGMTLLESTDGMVTVLLNASVGDCPAPGGAPNFTSVLELLSPRPNFTSVLALSAKQK